MPISAKCRNCGRSYSVKDEHAGKKFRCQECQSSVSVPLPKVPSRETADWDAEDYDDDYGTEDYEDYDDYESREPLPPPRRAAMKKKPVAKSKRPKKRSSSESGSGIGAAIGKIGGGLFVGLFVMGLVFRLMAAGGMDFGGSWDSYTTPDGNVTMQMPGKVKSVPVQQMAPGGQSFGAERRGYMCIVVIEPIPAEVNGLSEGEIYNAMEMGSRFLGATNVQGSNFKGRRCVTFEKSAPGGIKSHAKAFLHKGKFYTLTFAFKGSQGGNEEKFFNSVVFN